MQKLFHVYIIKNNINGKVYIGKTSGNYKYRWNKHVKIAEGNGSYSKYIKYPIHLAISKYGKDNFSFNVLESFYNENDAYAAEIKFIQKYNSIKCGYNLAAGGKTGGSGVESNVAIFNEADILSIFRDFIGGVAGAKIAKKMCCSKTTIYDILDRVIYCSVVIDDSIIRKTKEMRLSQKKTLPHLLDHQKIVDDYNYGMSYRQIAKKYNSSTFTIQKIIIKNVDQSIIDKNKMQPIDIKFAESVIDDYINSDLTAEQIGHKYKKSKYVIYDILRGKTSSLNDDIKNKIKSISKIKSARKYVAKY